jgi:hypothetical protein
MMKNRKGTPDIMSNLMLNTAIIDEEVNPKEIKEVSLEAINPESDKAGKQEDIKAIEQQCIKAIKQDNNKTIKQENIKIVEQDNNKTIKLSSSKAIKPYSNAESNALKEKATFNLSSNTLDDLDQAWFLLKRQLRGQRITKTLILEKALEIALVDLEKNSEKSIIFKKLKTNEL